MPDLHNALPVLMALGASIILLLRTPARLFPLVALVASALEVLRAMAILNVKVPVIGALVLFAVAMVVGAVGSWLKTSAKVPVTAAALVAFVGIMRLVSRYG